MISLKLEGLSGVVEKMQENWLEASQMDKIVKRAAEPLVQRIKEGYIAGGHSKTGDLVQSIEAFQRSRRAKDPYFTYYVGPSYTGGRNALFSRGGNAAHLLEFGTVDRFRANTKKGGVSLGKGRIYGAKYSTGKVKGYGVIRRSRDQYANQGIEFMKTEILALIKAEAKKRGLST